MRKRILSIFLSFAVVFAMMPGMAITASAGETHSHDDVTFNMELSSSYDGGELATGNYILTEDIDLSGSGNDITIPENAVVNLCLNGHVLKGTGNCSSAITVDENATLSIYDCDSTEQTHFFKVSGSGLWELQSAAPAQADYTFDEANGLKKNGAASSDIPAKDAVIAVSGGCITGGTGSGEEAGDTRGGGINNKGTLTFISGNIVGNSVTNRGGGIYNNNGFVTMTGGAIFGNNAAENGGGINNAEGSTLCITDGIVEYNMAGKVGGGAYNEGSITMTGGAIVKNVAEIAGGLMQVGSMTLGGAANIKDNTVSGEDSNLCFMRVEEEGTMVNTTTTIENLTSSAEIGISVLGMDEIGNFIPIVATDDLSIAFTTNGAFSDVQYFTSDDAHYGVKYVATTTNPEVAAHLELGTLSPHAHDMGTAVETDDVTFEHVITSEAELIDLFTNGGSGYLGKDIKLADESNNPEVKKDVKLCLNGKTLDLNGHKIYVNKTFELYDCEATGVIKNGKASQVGQSIGGAVLVSGEFVMYGGTIEDCEAIEGGAVYTYDSGTFRMYGGTIRNCSATCGGAVNCSLGSFHMYGGSIEGNKAKEYGGGVYNGVTSQSFHMHGGSITDNKAGLCGGGVFNLKDLSFDGKCVVKDNYSAYEKTITEETVYPYRDNVLTAVPFDIGNEKGTNTLTAGSEIWVTLAERDDSYSLKNTCVMGDVTTNGAKTEASYFHSDCDCYYVTYEGTEGEDGHVVLVSRINQQPAKDNNYTVGVNMDGLTKAMGYSDPANAAADLGYEWVHVKEISTDLKDAGISAFDCGTTEEQNENAIQSTWNCIRFTVPSGTESVTFTSEDEALSVDSWYDGTLTNTEGNYAFKMDPDGDTFAIAHESEEEVTFTIENVKFLSTTYEVISDTDAVLSTDAENGNTYFCWVHFKDDSWDSTDITEYLVSTPSGGGGGGGGSSTITVPVSGDKDTVNVQATISGSNATIKNVTSEEITQVGTGANVVVDLTGLGKTVASVSIPKETFENVAASDADGFEIRMPNGVVAIFDKATLVAIASQAKGDVIQLVVDRDSKAEQSLNAAQKKTVGTMNDPVVLDAYFTSNGQRISDFKGGEAELIAEYPTTTPVRVWYVADDGTKELIPSTYDGQVATFTVTHFSHYVVEKVDGSGHTGCPQDNTCVYAKFKDSDPKAWYHPGVHFCVENGYMVGVTVDKFAPSRTLSRAMIVTMLWRMDGSPCVDYAMTFRDVADGKWYAEAIRWAQSTGVVTGFNERSFKPDDNVTREQLAAILMRYADYKGVDVAKRADLAKFTDVKKISNWALENVKWANAAGIITGRLASTIAPTGNATRAEAATMVQRFCETVLK